MHSAKKAIAIVPNKYECLERFTFEDIGRFAQ